MLRIDLIRIVLHHNRMIVDSVIHNFIRMDFFLFRVPCKQIIIFRIIFRKQIL
jgi:hypothetical protein